MTEFRFKAGDKVRPINSDEVIPVTRTIDYVSHSFVVFTVRDDEGLSEQFSTPTARFHNHYEPVPEIFETGKSYRHSKWDASELGVTVLYADEHVVLARYTTASGRLVHTQLTPADRAVYIEVTN